jgi:predicted MFS family arabinose efflux permease
MSQTVPTVFVFRNKLINLGYERKIERNGRQIASIGKRMKATGITKVQTGIMAAAAGICVANIYYNQPILGDMARSLQVAESKTGLIAVLTQAGYGLGLFFVTPLGDKINRKRLILLLQVLLIGVLLGITFTRSLQGLYAMSLLIGVCSAATQVIMPMAASMDTVNRGRTVGIVFTGILVGILAARVVSGYVAEWFGWRYVYGISAGLVLVAAIVLQLALPNAPQGFSGNYGKLLLSTLRQVGRFAILRRTALLGALVFGAFCSFWTTLTFHFSGPPFHYHADTIGLFGLLATGGALVAPYFGKLADKGNPARSQLFSGILLLMSILLVKFFPFSIAAFLLAVLLLDVGVQATQVTNIATIYTLDAAANSRINTVYMTAYFIGGALGTFVGIKCWQAGGWPLVTGQLLLWSIAALAVAATGWRQLRRATATQ